MARAAPRPADPAAAKLAEAQRVLAKSYRASSWPRLVIAVELVDAIWRDDRARVLSLVEANPALLHEPVLLRPDSNWGPPMSYAANLGRDELIRQLHARGARDLEKAAGRAALQGHPGTVRMIHELAGRPPIDRGSLAGPAYTLNVAGTAVLFSLGVRVDGPDGVPPNVMEHLLGTDSRNSAAKRRILEMYVEHGFEPPDTPIMAFHRGRLDLLEAHLARDPELLTRTFPKAEIFPMAPACAAGPYTAQGTPLQGRRCCTLPRTSTMWTPPRGCSTTGWTRTSVPRSTPTASVAIRRSSQPSSPSATSGSTTVRGNPTRRASPGCCSIGGPTRTSARRSARSSRRATAAGRSHEVRDVTPLGWGEQYHAPIFVSRKVDATRGGGAGWRAVTAGRTRRWTLRRRDARTEADRST